MPGKPSNPGMNADRDPLSPDYGRWVGELKNRYRAAQIKAAVAVNRELLRFYWDLGRDIVLRFEREAGYGTGFFDRLSADLSRAIPEARGFSPVNLRYCRRFWRLYAGAENLPQPVEESADQNLPQLVEELSLVPWGHHRYIIDRCDGDREQALFYVRKTLANNWSRNVLLHFLDTDLYAREGKALTNFPATLPAPQSDLARETLKDPYKIDFGDIAEETTERELENALVAHVAEFLVELGAGFAYVGRQIRVKVGEEEFRLDLLFYHLKLRCYVVVELKAGKFRPEHLGQLGFYLTAVDEQIKDDRDGPTIGLLLCRTKDRIVAEYALRGETRPMGVSEYQIATSVPENLRGSLPSIAELEAGLACGENPTGMALPSSTSAAPPEGGAE
jgi:predicted nuclease of restriction endonuclease-like (RecB) superfamily